MGVAQHYVGTNMPPAPFDNVVLQQRLHPESAPSPSNGRQRHRHEDHYQASSRSYGSPPSVASHREPYLRESSLPHGPHSDTSVSPNIQCNLESHLNSVLTSREFPSAVRDVCATQLNDMYAINNRLQNEQQEVLQRLRAIEQGFRQEQVRVQNLVAELYGRISALEQAHQEERDRLQGALDAASSRLGTVEQDLDTFLPLAEVILEGWEEGTNLAAVLFTSQTFRASGAVKQMRELIEKNKKPPPST
ncbi:hypothetical protein NMY22_g12661 [Coprinellus aureogranulatus]|nr:hypothetical protein NMY22_g12661 [Coprinellus aureogranulatus]